jgi:hypothetical protein
MYFPDRVASLREMWRALAPGGRLAVAAWAPIEHARGYQILVEVADRQCGREAADVLSAPFVLGGDAQRRCEQALATEADQALAEFVVASGEIVMPMDAHIVTVSKG